MNILIASDAFKDALSSIEVCQAIARGLQLADKRFQTNIFPLADGGEGTSTILTFHSQGQLISTQVLDPLFRPIQATYGLSGDGKTAFIEMAQASGFQLLESSERNPWFTTTYGTGELLLDAIRQGAKKILLGIGSSATNDCGMGMACALGYRFWDAQGNLLEGRGGDLLAVAKIDAPKQNPLEGIEVEVICDVDNPLFGTKGAAYTYARQKGADDAMIKDLDAGLRQFSMVLSAHFQRNFAPIKGAGAAGGMGAGTSAFLKATLKGGVDLVMAYTQFDQQLEHANLVITGEGSIDQQSFHSKVVKGVCAKAKAKNIPVIGICGALRLTPKEVSELGLDAAFSIINTIRSLEKSIELSATNLEASAFNIGKLII